MTRAATVLLSVIAGLAALPEPAGATVVCAYDAAQHRLDIAATGGTDQPAVRRSGTLVLVHDGPLAVDCAGADATVTTTDTIHYVNGTSAPTTFSLHLEEGPLAPGYSAEYLGSPEIELTIDAGDGHDNLDVWGSTGKDTIRVGTVAGTPATRLNLNAEEVIGDSDVSATGLDGVALLSLGGDDVLDARGGGTTGAPYGGALYAAGYHGDDTIYTGASGGQAYGSEGKDTLIGGSGIDQLSPGPDDDVADGGGGVSDYVTFYQGLPGVTVDLDDAGPQATGDGTDTLTGFEAVAGTGGGDDLRGTAGVDRLFGQGGEDRLEGRGGDDKLDGGPGDDVTAYPAAPSGVTVNLGGDAPQTSGGGGQDSLTDVEGAIGSDHADEIIGDDGANRIDGGVGTDSLDGGGGIDTLSYASRKTAVAVRLDGLQNDGSDPDGNGISTQAEEGDHAKAFENAEGGYGPDRLRALGNAANSLLGRGGDDRLDGGPGSDVLDGGAGADTVSYAGRTDAVAVRLDGQKNDGADPDGDGYSEAGEEADHAKGVENATGGDGPDRLYAFTTVVNVLTGGPGPDVLHGQDGSVTKADVLKCGTGADEHKSDAIDTKESCETATP